MAIASCPWFPYDPVYSDTDCRLWMHSDQVGHYTNHHGGPRPSERFCITEYPGFIVLLDYWCSRAKWIHRKCQEAGHLWGSICLWGSRVDDDNIRTWWRHFLHCWPFVRGIHQLPEISPYDGPVLMLAALFSWTSCWIKTQLSCPFTEMPRCSCNITNVVRVTFGVWK